MIVFILRNIFNILCLSLCPSLFECSSIGCSTLFCTGCRSSNLRCYLCSCIFYVACISLTYSGSSTRAAVLCEIIYYIIPIMSQHIACSSATDRTGSGSITGSITVIMLYFRLFNISRVVTSGAGYVCIPTDFCTGGCFSLV